MVALLPFVRGLLPGQAFFFRDLAGHFFPLRVFVTSGLREGHAALLEPAHPRGRAPGPPSGGLPPRSPAGPLGLGSGDLRAPGPSRPPGRAGHVCPRADGSGWAPWAAAGGALAYALGGFALSSLNLYVYLQAIAWAPFVILGLLRAASGTGHDVARAASPWRWPFPPRASRSSRQALLAGVRLAWPRDRRAFARLAVALLLGLGLAGGGGPAHGRPRGGTPPGGTASAPTSCSRHSVHPITLLQTVLLGLYADPARLTDTLLGAELLPAGLPLLPEPLPGRADPGPRSPRRPARHADGAGAGRTRLAGPGHQPRGLRRARPGRGRARLFAPVPLPVEGLLPGAVVHRPARWGWPFIPCRDKRTRARGGAPGSCSSPSEGRWPSCRGWPCMRAGPRRFLLAGFFPCELAWPAREAAAGAIVERRPTGALFAVLAGARGPCWPRAAGFRPAGPLPSSSRCWPPTSFGRGPASTRWSPPRSIGRPRKPGSSLDGCGPRVGACSPLTRGTARPTTRPAPHVPTTRCGRSWCCARPSSPASTSRLAVPTALSLDQTMLVPDLARPRPRRRRPGRAPPRDRTPARRRRFARGGGRAVVASGPRAPRPAFCRKPGPSAHTRLQAAREPSLGRSAGSWRRGRASGPAGATPVSVTAEPGAVLLVREAWAPGWGAFVDGVPAAIDRRQTPYFAVPVPSGGHRVDLVYTPPGLRPGLALTLASAAVAVWLRLRPRRV